MRRSRHQTRRGFTLIELLVAITIMTFLATLAVALLPRLNEQERARRGADMLQGWLLTAKNLALRANAPRGLRLISDPANTRFIREVAFIEQPGDFQVQIAAGQIRPLFIPDPATANDNIAVLQAPSSGTWPDFTGGSTNLSTTANDWPVQVGDYLEIQGGGLLHQITGIYVTNPTYTDPKAILKLASVPSVPATNGYLIAPTVSYRIIRAPRLLVGEEPLQLPNNVAIDTNGTIPKGFSPNGYSDILFAPSGRLLNAPSASNVILWVCDSSQDSASGQPITTNQPVLLCIVPGTGLTSLYPVDLSGPDPYSFTKSALDGGL